MADYLKLDKFIEQFPLMGACFIGIYAMGVGQDETFDADMAAMMMQTTGLDHQKVEDELRGLTGAQMACIIKMDPGEVLPEAPLVCKWLDRAYE